MEHFTEEMVFTLASYTFCCCCFCCFAFACDVELCVKPVCIKPFQIRSHPLKWIGVMLSLTKFLRYNLFAKTKTYYFLLVPHAFTILKTPPSPINSSVILAGSCTRSIHSLQALWFITLYLKSIRVPKQKKN